MDLANLICKPKKPECPKCPISKFCFSYKDGMTETIPAKIPKKVKSQKRGFVFFIKNKEGQFLLERRPDNGLLGGLLAFPTSEWAEIAPKLHYPVRAEWENRFSIINHEFSHFKLELKLVVGTTESIKSFGSGYKVFNLGNFQKSVLPTLMRKVLNEIHKNTKKSDGS
jgi:A/G-specific adenine glycosylase